MWDRWRCLRRRSRRSTTSLFGWVAMACSACSSARPPVGGVEPGLHAPDSGQVRHGLAHSGAHEDVSEVEALDDSGERVLELGLREPLGLRPPEGRLQLPVGLALRFEQRRPVPAFEQGGRAGEARRLGVVVPMGRRETLGLHEDAVGEEDPGDEPDAPTQPRVGSQLRGDGPQDAAQRSQPRTLRVISSRLSPPRTGSARTWSKRGSASRART